MRSTPVATDPRSTAFHLTSRRSDMTISAAPPSLRLIHPQDEAYDTARLAWNLAVDQRPAAVAFPTDAEEVAAVVRYARDNGYRVAPQRTGHNAGPLGSLEDVIIVRTDRLTGVEVDAKGRRARVGAATKWEDVVPQASDLGLAALHGSTGDVSVVGYSLGGGLGWDAPQHGPAANKGTAGGDGTPRGRPRPPRPRPHAR